MNVEIPIRDIDITSVTNETVKRYKGSPKAIRATLFFIAQDYAEWKAEEIIEKVADAVYTEMMSKTKVRKAIGKGVSE